MRVRSRWLVGCMIFGLAGCGSPGAAEPADAPVPLVEPAGRVVPLDGQAEGVVADPTTGIVVVAVREPFGLVLVDGQSGEVVGQVPLPGPVRHLQLAAPGGPVLVPSEGSGEVITVELPDGAVGSRIQIGEWAHDATATADGTIAVTDEMGASVVLVRDGQVVHRFADVTQPGGVAAVDQLVGVVDVHEQTLSVYDTERLERTGRVSAGHGPTHIVADRFGRLVVVDTRGGWVLLFATSPSLHLVGQAWLSGSPYGLTYDPIRDRLWVTLTAFNQVVGLDVSDHRPREVARIPTVRQPNSVAVDPTTGRLFVASRVDGILQLIDAPVPIAGHRGTS
jgi:DNA-binding beta-propeller fold protein YncE